MDKKPTDSKEITGLKKPSGAPPSKAPATQSAGTSKQADQPKKPSATTSLMDLPSLGPKTGAQATSNAKSTVAANTSASKTKPAQTTKDAVKDTKLNAKKNDEIEEEIDEDYEEDFDDDDGVAGDLSVSKTADKLPKLGGGAGGSETSKTTKGTHDKVVKKEEGKAADSQWSAPTQDKSKQTTNLKVQEPPVNKVIDSKEPPKKVAESVAPPKNIKTEQNQGKVGGNQQPVAVTKQDSKKPLEDSKKPVVADTSNIKVQAKDKSDPKLPDKTKVEEKKVVEKQDQQKQSQVKDDKKESVGAVNDPKKDLAASKDQKNVSKEPVQAAGSSQQTSKQQPKTLPAQTQPQQQSISEQQPKKQDKKQEVKVDPVQDKKIQEKDIKKPPPQEQTKVPEPKKEEKKVDKQEVIKKDPEVKKIDDKPKVPEPSKIPSTSKDQNKLQKDPPIEQNNKGPADLPAQKKDVPNISNKLDPKEPNAQNKLDPKAPIEKKQEKKTDSAKDKEQIEKKTNEQAKIKEDAKKDNNQLEKVQSKKEDAHKQNQPPQINKTDKKEEVKTDSKKEKVDNIVQKKEEIKQPVSDKKKEVSKAEEPPNKTTSIEQQKKDEKKEKIDDKQIQEKPDKPKELDQPNAQALPEDKTKSNSTKNEAQKIESKVDSTAEKVPGSQQAAKQVKFEQDFDKKDALKPEEPSSLFGDELNQFSLDIQEQASRMQKWLVNMRQFKLFNADRLPSPLHDEYKMYSIKFGDLLPQVKIPKLEGYQPDQLAITLQINGTLCDPQVGLFGRTCVLKFGGKENDAKGHPVPVDPKDLKIDSYMYLHSDLDLKMTHVICEFNIFIYDKNKENQMISHLSLGLLPIRLIEDAPKDANQQQQPRQEEEMSLFLTTPRIFMMFQEGQTVQQKMDKVKQAPYKIKVIVQDQYAPLTSKQLFQLVQPNCLVCNQDNIPGIKEQEGPASTISTLPKEYHNKFLEDIKFEKLAEVYAHSIELDQLGEIERIFRLWLGDQVQGSGYEAHISSRRLTIAPSNSCFVNPIASQSFIELKCTEIKGKKSSKGKQQQQFRIEVPKDKIPLKISNLIVHSLSCLVIRIVYKVKYLQRDVQEQSRDFVLGRKAFFPNFDLKYGSGYVNDRKVSFKLSMCPELSIINDQLWDVNKSDLSSHDLIIGLQMHLSILDRLPSVDEQQKMREQILKNEHQKSEKRHLQEKVGAGPGSASELDQATIQRLADLQFELNKYKEDNEMLQKKIEEKEKIDQKEQDQKRDKKDDKVAEDQLDKKEQPDLQKDDQQPSSRNVNDTQKKEEESSKNQVLAQLKIQKESSSSPQRVPMGYGGDMSPHSLQKNRMLDVLLSREDTDVAKLLELLKKLLERKDENQVQYRDVIQKLQTNIKRMLEGDPYSQMSIVGRSGYFNTGKNSNLPDNDKKLLAVNEVFKDGIPKNIDIEKAIPVKPKLELEYKDPMMASTISLKFVAFKTANNWSQQIQMPTRVFFTMKFYMFRETMTEQVVLRLPKSVARTMKSQTMLQNQNSGSPSLLRGRQYFLMKFQDQARIPPSNENSIKSQIDDDYIGLSNSLEIAFDFDPNSFIPNIDEILKKQFFEEQKQKKRQAQRPKTAESTFGATDLLSTASANQILTELEKQEHKMFCQYLQDRVLTIDIWNGDSMMHFGTCKVPLHLLMRQGEPSKFVGQEFVVIEPEQAEVVGGLQMVITNHGRILKKPKTIDTRDLIDGKSLSKEAVGYNTQKYKKIVSSNPLEGFELQETLKDKIQNEMIFATKHNKAQIDEEQRKKMRVDRLKKLTLNHEISAADGPGGIISNFNDPNSSDWDKNNQLKQISLIREQRKAQIIAKVCQEAQIMNQQSIEVVSGLPTLFEITVKNPYEKRQNFQISIHDKDMDEGRIRDPELKVIDNTNGEWLHWYDRGKCQQSNDWNIVDAKNKTIRLEGSQQCNILFKFQSFREPVIDGRTPNKTQSLNSSSNHCELHPRQIKIEVLNTDFFPITQLVVNVQPRYMIVDQVFRFYEPQNTISTSIIPNFIDFIGNSSGRDVIPLTNCFIESSNRHIEIKPNDQNELLAIIKNGPSMTLEKGYVFIFSDELKSKLLGACKIEIQSCLPLNIKVKAGEEYDYYLKVFNPVASEQEGVKQRIIEVFSTDRQLIYPPNGRMRNTKQLLPIRKDPQMIAISLMSRQQGQSKARVNVVDIHSRQLIESFLIQVDAEKPQIDQAFSIDCNQHQQNFYKIKFRNPFDDEQAMFAISSSDALLVQPKTDIMKFQPNEEKDICLIIPKQSIIKVFEAIVHINRIQTSQDDADQAAGGKSSYAKAQQIGGSKGQNILKDQFEQYSESILFKINIHRAARESKKRKPVQQAGVKVPENNQQEQRQASKILQKN